AAMMMMAATIAMITHAQVGIGGLLSSVAGDVRGPFPPTGRRYASRNQPGPGTGGWREPAAGTCPAPPPSPPAPGPPRAPPPPGRLVPPLRVSSAAEPGIRRIARGRRVAYRDDRGRPVTDVRTVERIERLAIPPAWTDVWICRSRRGHMQATGRDARGRKQYRYQPDWREEQDRMKHRRMVRFARRLPALRATARRHLRRRGLPREKALATAVLILDRTAIRIGSEEYARSNGTYGLATMRSRHVTVEADTVILDFTGKGGKRHQ